MSWMGRRLTDRRPAGVSSRASLVGREVEHEQGIFERS